MEHIRKGSSHNEIDTNKGLISGRMDFDELLSQHVGEFGYYQRILFFIIASEMMFCVFQTLSPVFLTLTPPFTCAIPNSSATNCSYDQLKDYFIPKILKDGKWVYDQCHIYIRNASTDNINNVCGAENTSLTSGLLKAKCDSYHYADSHYTSTIVTQWDLVCDQASHVATVSAVFMVGRLVGSLVFGTLTDKYGRRPIILIMSFVHMITSTVLAFSPSYGWFIGFRFVLAIASIARTTACFVAAIELIGPKWRVFAGSLFMTVWAVGYAIFAGIGYLFHDWQHLQLALSVPEISIIVLFFIFVPESPRWLLVKGRTTEAMQILGHIAKKNGKNIPDNIDVVVKVEKITASILDLLKRPGIRRTSLNFFFSWFTLGGVYYGLALNTSNFGGDPFLNCFISGALEVPGYLSVIFVMTRYGRVKSYGVYILIGSIALLATILVPIGLINVQVCLAMIGKFFIASAYTMAWIFTPEVYATSIRSVTLSYCSVFSRIASALGSYVFLLSAYHHVLPLLLLGGISLAAGILVFGLPETKGQPLPQTVDECEKLINESSSHQCRCRKNKSGNRTEMAI